jgi:hypothetical protein
LRTTWRAQLRSRSVCDAASNVTQTILGTAVVGGTAVTPFVQYAYDSRGNLTEREDALNHATLYA